MDEVKISEGFGNELKEDVGEVVISYIDNMIKAMKNALLEQDGGEQANIQFSVKIDLASTNGVSYDWTIEPKLSKSNTYKFEKKIGHYDPNQPDMFKKPVPVVANDETVPLNKPKFIKSYAKEAGII